MPKPNPFLTDPVKEIVKRIERVTYTGYRASQIFDDWLAMCELGLDRLPSFWNQITHQLPLADSPEFAARWQPFAGRYGQGSGEALKLLAECFAILIETSGDAEGAPTFEDVLGSVYMAFVCPSDAKYKGQFFTPLTIARCMAQISMGDVTAELVKRLEAALADTPTFRLAQVLGVELKPETKAQMLDLDDARTRFQPITVSDPACGSGVMLLAAASCCPPWALRYRLVEFYGMDIDATCVQMARLNCRLYGLNGCGYVLAGDPADLTQMEAAVRAARMNRVALPAPVAVAETTPAQNVPVAILEVPHAVAAAPTLPLLLDDLPAPIVLPHGRGKRSGRNGNGNGDGHHGDRGMDDVPVPLPLFEPVEPA